MNFGLWYKKYQTVLYKNKIKVNINLYFIFAFVVAIVAAFLLIFVANIVLGVIAFLSVFDLFIGYPLYKEEKRITEIEKHFPNALREISYLLKTGGTYEYAIRELTSFDYGPLNSEFEQVLMRLEQGYNFEESISIISENVNSQMIRKTISIINDAIKAGASLADILEDLSGDMKKAYNLELDRKAKTIMQVLFIFAAGAIIAPSIYGLVLTLIDFLINVTSSSGVANAATVLTAKGVRGLLELVITIFVLVQALASTFMVVFMREKKYAKVFLYLPLFLLFAYICFYGAKFLSEYLLMGML